MGKHTLCGLFPHFMLLTVHVLAANKVLKNQGCYHPYICIIQNLGATLECKIGLDSSVTVGLYGETGQKYSNTDSDTVQ